VGNSVGTDVGDALEGLRVGLFVGVNVRPTGPVGLTGDLVSPGALVVFGVGTFEGLGEIVGLVPIGCSVKG
jgi:hypothetical protein